ncbi:MAG: hypothetical protein KGI51_12505, partial [Rhodospirillales bacterium]|nr:hypothetical protein [Rhodospirillales bacterium]
MRITKGIVATAMLGAALLAAPRARATPGTFTGSFVNATSHNLDAASAVFSLSGTTLQIVLTNTSTFGAYQNPDVLSGLLFDITGTPTLTPISATASGLITPPSTTVSGPTNVDSGWGFVASPTGFAYTGATGCSTGKVTTGAYGVAAAGYSCLSPNFPKSNFGSGNGTNLGGLGYSIVGSAFASISGNASPLAENSVTFDFGVPQNSMTL